MTHQSNKGAGVPKLIGDNDFSKMPIDKPVIVLHKYGIDYVLYRSQKWTYCYSGRPVEDPSIFTHWFSLDESPSSESPAREEGAVDHEAEKEEMIYAFSRFRKIFEGRRWIMDGRGCYPYNDDRYKEEVRYLFDEFELIEKDMWASIKSKTFEYRNKVIADYIKENPPARAVSSTDREADIIKRFLNCVDIAIKDHDDPDVLLAYKHCKIMIEMLADVEPAPPPSTDEGEQSKTLKLQDYPHLVQLKKDVEAIQFGTKHYWEQRCRYREKMDDPTYSDFERSNCSLFFRILVNKEK